MMKFEDYIKLTKDEDDYVMVDLDTVPLRIRVDYARRNDNVEQGKTLCERCEGTGNQLYAMYQKCEDCNGEGYE